MPSLLSTLSSAYQQFLTPVTPKRSTILVMVALGVFGGFGIDMTDQRKGQEALEKERTFISTVLDTAGALVIILNPHWQILRMNHACEYTVQHSFEDLKGEPSRSLVLSGSVKKAF